MSTTLAQDIGLVGARVEITGDVRSAHHRFTEYGTTTEIVFVTGDGVRVRWDASRHMELAVGESLTVRATIKAYPKGEDHDVLVTRGTVCEAPSTLF
jgi:D-lyxose ketol-isomerase